MGLVLGGAVVIYGTFYQFPESERWYQHRNEGYRCSRRANEALVSRRIESPYLTWKVRPVVDPMNSVMVG